MVTHDILVNSTFRYYELSLRRLLSEKLEEMEQVGLLVVSGADSFQEGRLKAPNRGNS